MKHRPKPDDHCKGKKDERFPGSHRRVPSVNSSRSRPSLSRRFQNNNGSNRRTPRRATESRIHGVDRPSGYLLHLPSQGFVPKEVPQVMPKDRARTPYDTVRGFRFLTEYLALLRTARDTRENAPLPTTRRTGIMSSVSCLDPALGVSSK